MCTVICLEPVFEDYSLGMETSTQPTFQLLFRPLNRSNQTDTAMTTVTTKDLGASHLHEGDCKGYSVEQHAFMQNIRGIHGVVGTRNVN